MSNAYEPPKSDVASVESENNSGMKKETFPEGVKGFCWGGLFLNWIWAPFNKTYIGLLAILPYIGFIVALYLGFKGRELAWKNKRWESLERFNAVQKRWSIWGIAISIIIPCIGILAAIAIPAYQDYVTRAAG